ncbi:LytTR family transcriptional regulator DNA-binding domain-containing protein [Butyrivibrio fibrisolvens]
MHRSILVNLERISQYDSSHITLDNGNTLSLSRRRYKDFESAFNAFISGE